MIQPSSVAELLGLDISLILASQSPRRKQLLQQLGLEFNVIPSAVDEEAIHNLSLTPDEYVRHLALHKATDVATHYSNSCIVIGADTTVVLDETILNKPTDEKSAFDMLALLSDRTHHVYTGVALVRKDGVTVTNQSFVQKTAVTFRKLSDEEIYAYIATGSPMDKAGAYGIQDDMGAIFVSRIEGCYYNIVGLPLELLYRTLKEFLRK
jgi:septum formation protein